MKPEHQDAILVVIIVITVILFGVLARAFEFWLFSKIVG